MKLQKYIESEFILPNMSNDLKVYTPSEIEETPFPQEGQASFQTTQSTSNETYSPKTTKEVDFPDRRVAHEVLSAALNTRSKKILQPFEFTQSGALQIGNYQEGVNGDIRISGAGIVARNSLGSNTFVLDSETGDAFFAGTIQTGTLISGLVVVGNNSIILDGDANSPRILLYNNDIPEILIGERG